MRLVDSALLQFEAIKGNSPELQVAAVSQAEVSEHESRLPLRRTPRS